MTAKIDDFSITIDSSLFIFSTVMTEVALHQPGLGVVRIYLQDSIEEDFGDIPPFLRDCPRSVRTINPNLRVLFEFFYSRFAVEDFEGFHLFRSENVSFLKNCQEMFKNF